MRIHLDRLKQNWKDGGVSQDIARGAEAFIEDDGITLEAVGTLQEYKQSQIISLDKESALLLAKSILIKLKEEL